MVVSKHAVRKLCMSIRSRCDWPGEWASSSARLGVTCVRLAACPSWGVWACCRMETETLQACCSPHASVRCLETGGNCPTETPSDRSDTATEWSERAGERAREDARGQGWHYFVVMTKTSETQISFMNKIKIRHLLRDSFTDYHWRNVWISDVWTKQPFYNYNELDFLWTSTYSKKKWFKWNETDKMTQIKRNS